MRVEEYETRFEYILGTKLEQKQKDKMLSGLMTDLERTFQIPMVKNEMWEKENPEVYALYHKIADSRLL
jgi:tRNA A22 N-methylase